MAYFSAKLKKRLAEGPKTLGTQLCVWAIERGLSVYQISAATTATRQTIYNWSKGGEVRMRFRERVARTIEILHAVENGDEAWQMICAEFSLEP